MKVIGFLCLSFLSLNVNANAALDGAISGGGGKGVVCRASDNSIRSVQLLDLWEGQTLYAETPMKSTGVLQQDVDNILLRLKDSYPFTGTTCRYGSDVYHDQDCLLQRLRGSAKVFYGENPNVLRLRNVTLTLTDDSYEVAKPTNCGIEQIVNFQPDNRIIVNQDLFDAMDPENQAALIAHESLYVYLRSDSHETTSIRVRRAVGVATSGGSFNVTHPPDVQTGNFCEASDPVLGEIQFYFYPVAYPAGSAVGIYPELLYGSPLMGAGAWTFVTPPNQYWADLALGKTCQTEWSASTDMGLSGSGPIEFDRILRFAWICRTGQAPQTVLIGGNVGTPSTQQIPLTCHTF